MIYPTPPSIFHEVAQDEPHVEGEGWVFLGLESKNP